MILFLLRPQAHTEAWPCFALAEFTKHGKLGIFQMVLSSLGRSSINGGYFHCHVKNLFDCRNLCFLQFNIIPDGKLTYLCSKPTVSLWDDICIYCICIIYQYGF